MSKNSATIVSRRDRKQGKASQPVYFLSLSVENVRCFGPKQTLDLSDGNGRPAQWTILLGENGVGKTTLLQCLASLMPTSHPDLNRGNRELPHASPRLITDLKIRDFWNPYRDLQGQNLLEVSCAFSNGFRFNKQSDVPLSRHYLYFKQTGPGIDFADVLLGFSAFTWPEYEKVSGILYFGYGASRRMGETSISDEDNDPTASLFDENIALVNAEEWLLQADYAASKKSSVQKLAKEYLEKIKNVLIKLLPDVEDIRFPQLTETQMKPRVEFKTPYGWVSIKDLGLGYRTLIAWMVDFAARMFDRYPNSPNPLAEPAIVLVDEIDLHLHPKWQRTLMSFLSNLFPNTQFIATAHSPLVVQAATNANIALLKREGDHVVIDNDVKAVHGWRIDQVLTSDLFGLESARPPELDDKLAERNRLLAKGKLTKKDRQRLKELETEIGPLPFGETPTDIEAMDIIRRAAERLKQQNDQALNDSNK